MNRSVESIARDGASYRRASVFVYIRTEYVKYGLF
jgi:hypothetical protein